MTQNSTPRVDISDVFAEAFKAQAGLTQAIWKKADELGVGRDVIELIYVRCSQINSCAFCLDVHVREGLKAKVSTTKLSVLAAWEETTGIYTDEERAAIEIAEAVSELSQRHLSDADYDRLRGILGDDKLALFMWAAIGINGWNRVAVMKKQPVEGR